MEVSRILVTAATLAAITFDSAVSTRQEDYLSTSEEDSHDAFKVIHGATNMTSIAMKTDSASGPNNASNAATTVFYGRHSSCCRPGIKR
ncbi:hypothetical protein GN244_ATG01987 [Phytophthora infestans]|uniref:Uncharacterized protein n=1 Tax=Phytophthora infestans TaxID=4787 RepID=A0A833TKN0_PHYIN|nr:hypothetical protein GN244_ATG01987 [Phytophthora infestans]KAF4144393.1 hypothetical protein GN958_ATG06403 [Phytophthora infestans]